MRLMQFIIFFGIVLTVYTLLNYYIFSRGLRTFEPGSTLRTFYIVGFWALAATFILGRVLEKIYLSHLSDFFTWTGSFWLAAMLYLFLAVVAIDIVRLINHFVSFFHHFEGIIWMQKPYLITVFVSVVVFLLVLVGHLNALNPRIKEININTGTKSMHGKSLRLVMASDVHLGTIISKKRLTKYVKLINELKPEAVLFAGDILDEDLAPVIKQNLGDLLNTIDAPLGVYGTTGNHEYIGGASRAIEYLSGHGIKMMGDTMTQLVDNVYLAGREDIESVRFAGKTRKKLDSFTGSRPHDSYLIVLDHQPRAIPEAVDAGVGLLLSGHTHHGQMWPLNYITQAAFPVSWGLKKFEKTNVYVSSGLGSWGPPVRIGNKPEIVVITLMFDE